ncbi:sphingoid long chain base kinase [Schizosaccharomyces cryophilus OY26]|uniref:Sphingoid long chain base kinase n=1 Tax=Schizosaccharomyces cryophilus (strain OY26 / ATCC MYA-4695 / CBS 11777 / NBRC 106824 / NRRL Y48691) TaxID=653667 RepID=S9X5R2_SCHCR|nr:sphingoid long chain base kinase [Schizosaccharomyces cryophilus OY26]EPY52397.1 sphingoid long chain base kinase [Schizosaccharomyces cryophilus OY26]
MQFGFIENSIVLDEDERILYVHKSCLVLPTIVNSCCSLKELKPDLLLPLKYLLRVDTVDSQAVVLHFLSPSTKKCSHCTVFSLNDAIEFRESLMEKGYTGAHGFKRFLVLINPFGGQGKAKQIWQQSASPVFQTAHLDCQVIFTEYRNHARSIVRNIDLNTLDAILSVGGDGLFHECLNGLGDRKDSDSAFETPLCMIPGGTGNAFSYNATQQTHPALVALEIVKGVKKSFDLMSFDQNGSRSYSFLSANYGIIADSDVGTDNLRFMGENRAFLGFFLRLLQKPSWNCKVEMEVVSSDRNEIRKNYLQHLQRTSVNRDGGFADNIIKLPLYNEENISRVNLDINDLSVFYAGLLPYVAADMRVFPACHVDDGLIDIAVVRANPFRKSLLSIFTCVESGEHFYSKYLSYYKVRSFRFTPINTGHHHFFVLDGEEYPFEPFECRAAPSLGTTLASQAGFKLLSL